MDKPGISPGFFIYPNAFIDKDCFMEKVFLKNTANMLKSMKKSCLPVLTSPKSLGMIRAGF